MARFLQYFGNLFNSFINILAILQDFNGIFLKHSLNITMLCGLLISQIFYRESKYRNMDSLYSGSSSASRHFFLPACFRVGSITPPDSHSNR